MSPGFAKKANIALIKKQYAYEVNAVNGKPLEYNNGMVDHETEDTRLMIGPHVRDMRFDITVTGKHDVVLGLPWLEEVDPAIGFRQRTIRFSTGKPVRMGHGLGSVMEICAISADELNKEIRENPEQVKVLWSKLTN